MWGERWGEVKGDFMMAKTVKGRISKDSFDDFLESQGTLAEAEDVAIKRVLAWQIAEGMKAEGITKTVMASRMKTDRRQLDRLLDPENKSVTLSTLRRAATALGRKLYVEIGRRAQQQRAGYQIDTNTILRKHESRQAG
jgi:antitoxin HicB